MITYATNDMIPYLKDIWKKCFGDSDEYIDMFFSGRYKNGRCIVYLENTIPAAMLILYEGKIINSMYEKNALYIYGVATHPNYQKQGISTQLLNFAKNLCASEKKNAVLAPSEHKLTYFYGKRGFYPSFNINTLKISALKSNIKINRKPLTAERYFELRSEYLKNTPYFQWDTDILAYAISENSFCGGKAYEVEYPGGSFAILYHVSEKTLFVQEITIRNNSFADCLNKIAEYENCDTISVRSLTEFHNSEKKVIAMSDDCNLNGYMNIVFD